MAKEPEIIDYHTYIEPHCLMDPLWGRAYVLRLPDDSVRMVFDLDDFDKDFSGAFYIAAGKEIGVLQKRPSKIQKLAEPLPPDILTFLREKTHQGGGRRTHDSRVSDRRYVISEKDYIDPSDKEQGVIARLFEIVDNLENEIRTCMVRVRNGEIVLSHARHLSSGDVPYLHFMNYKDLWVYSRKADDKAKAAIFDYVSGVYNFGQPHPDAVPLVMRRQEVKGRHHVKARDYLLRTWTGNFETVCLPVTASRQTDYERCERQGVRRAIQDFDRERDNICRPAPPEGDPIVVSRSTCFVISSLYTNDPKQPEGFVYRLIYPDGTPRDLALFCDPKRPKDYSLMKFVAPGAIAPESHRLIVAFGDNMNNLPCSAEPVPPGYAKWISAFDKRRLFDAGNYLETPFDHMTYFQRPEKVQGRHLEGQMYKYKQLNGKDRVVVCYENLTEDGSIEKAVRYAKPVPDMYRDPSWERFYDDSILLAEAVPEDEAHYIRLYDSCFGKLKTAEIKKCQRQFAKNNPCTPK